jgi:hypothetical protein
MAINLSLFLAQVNNLIPDITANELTTLNRYQLIKSAVRKYSDDMPDEVTVDVTGDGGRYYNITNLSQWSDEFSRIISIQYPAPDVSLDEEPIFLEADDWRTDYYDGTTQYIFLPKHAPSASEAFRVKYTAPYTWTASSATEAVFQSSHGFSANDAVYENSAGTWVAAGDDISLLATHIVTVVTDGDNFTAALLQTAIPTNDFFAVCNLAACYVCRAISAKYSRTSDSTIGLDSVDHPSRGREFAQRANEFCAMYSEHTGQGTGAGDGERMVQGYAEFVDWDNAPGWPHGRQFVFHNRHTR